MANINSGTIKAVLSLASRNVTNDILNLKVNDTLVVLEDVVQKRVVLSITASLRFFKVLCFCKQCKYK